MSLWLLLLLPAIVCLFRWTFIFFFRFFIWCWAHGLSLFVCALFGECDCLASSLHVDHDQVASLVRHPAVAHVAFTGSVAGGRAVYANVAAHRFIDVVLMSFAICFCMLSENVFP